MKEKIKPWVTIRSVAFIACGILVAGLYLTYLSMIHEVRTLREDVTVATASLVALSASSTAEREAIQTKLMELSDGLYNEQKRVADLIENFEDFEGDVDKLSGSVETLEKISTTDPQLLQKYSRIYFLNEHYIPADLEPLPEEYDLVNGKEVTIHAQVLPFLEDLLEASHEDGVALMVLSGYRSFEEQSTLKQQYTTRYGVGANTFSADQGYSEHQLGTTVDFTDTAIGENLSGFGATEAYRWLLANAYKYGFILSYPENNEYYVYEPWHWRFVGKDLARYLNRRDKNFYDMEQRDIDEYIATLFDR